MNFVQFSSTDIKDLTQRMQDLHFQYDREMTKEGLEYKITRVACVLRVQQALYAQGREDLAAVNSFRKDVMLPPITAHDNRVVTWTLHSYHVVDAEHPLSRAFDIVILLPGGKPTWDIKVDTNHSGHPAYALSGAIWKRLGGVWGGDFKNPDRPHHQEPRA